MTRGTGKVAQNVLLLARYVSPVKKSESSRKELSGFCVCLFECNRVEKRTKFRKLEPPGTLIWPQCLSPMVFKPHFWTICPEVEKNQLLSFARRTILLQILWSKCYIVQEIVLFINERQLCLANQIFMQA